MNETYWPCDETDEEREPWTLDLGRGLKKKRALSLFKVWYPPPKQEREEVNRRVSENKGSSEVDGK